jgi:hypothetical protein
VVRRVVRFAMVRLVVVRFIMVWFIVIRFVVVRFIMVWFIVIRFVVVWLVMVWSVVLIEGLIVIRFVVVWSMVLIRGLIHVVLKPRLHIIGSLVNCRFCSAECFVHEAHGALADIGPCILGGILRTLEVLLEAAEEVFLGTEKVILGGNGFIVPA